MRKFLAVGGLVVVLLTAMAAPALAQRDPFDPLIDEGGGGVVSGDTGGTVVQPAPEAPVSGEGLANTGSDISGWVALSYALIAAGAGAIALTSVRRRPDPLRADRRAR